MPIDRFSRLTLGTNLTGTDQGDGELLVDATGGGTETLPATIIDAKGDLIGGTAADTAARLAVGTNAQVLTADSAETTGMKWATPSAGAAGAITLLSTTTLSGAGTFDVTGISGSYNDLQLVLVGRSARAVGDDGIRLQINGDTGSNYYSEIGNMSDNTHVTTRELTTSAYVGRLSDTAAPANAFGFVEVTLYRYAATTHQKPGDFRSYEIWSSAVGGQTRLQGGFLWASTAAITRVQLFGIATANLVTGSSLRIYGRL